ncbi:MAG: hypothetical protein KIS66_10315 [Fimbriimonadaceae bacterium]|nr:hypothetical protein [Fimbriimonadaceae bacterium]
MRLNLTRSSIAVVAFAALLGSWACGGAGAETGGNGLNGVYAGQLSAGRAGAAIVDLLVEFEDGKGSAILTDSATGDQAYASVADAGIQADGSVGFVLKEFSDTQTKRITFRGAASVDTLSGDYTVEEEDGSSHRGAYVVQYQDGVVRPEVAGGWLGALSSTMGGVSTTAAGDWSGTISQTGAAVTGLFNIATGDGTIPATMGGKLIGTHGAWRVATSQGTMLWSVTLATNGRSLTGTYVARNLAGEETDRGTVTGSR